MKKYCLVFMMMLLTLTVSAYDLSVENNDGITIYYNYINDGKELEVVYGSYSGNLVIPEEVTYMDRTRKVTSIGKGAFHWCWGLTSIVIPNSVTKIGDRAFDRCKELTSIIIPNSVTSIGIQTFEYCDGLTSVIISNSVDTIGQAVFCGCSSLTSITIPEGVKDIGWGAFAECSNLTSINIPNNVTTIEKYAFSGCSSLTSITIPNSVTNIGEKAFDGCNFISVISLIQNPFSINNNSSDKRTFSKNTFYNATLYVPEGTVDQYKATEGWKDFVYIEDYNSLSHRTVNVLTAGSLSSIIPESEKYEIEELTLTGEINSDDLGFLREMAGKERKSHSMPFNDTEGKLVSLDISKAKIVAGGVSLSVNEIDNDFEFAVTRDNEIPPRIFEDCKNLANISISDDVYSIGSRAFHGTKWYDNQPDGLVYIGNMLYSYKGNMPTNTDVTIKDGTIGIACSAFSSCKNLVSVKIPNSIINIGGFNKYPNVGFDGAFNGCTGLKSVISEIQNPPVIEYSTFGSSDNTIYSNATLYVPTGTIDVYKSTEGWNNFTNVEKGTDAKVKLNKSKATLLKGKTLTLKATVLPETLEDKSVTWKSSNKKVATVSSKGKVKGIKAGTATITCTSKATGVTAKCKVTVFNGTVKLNKTELFIEKGTKKTLKATLTPTTLKDKSVTWTSSNKKIATVSSTGKVKGVKYGTAIITCTSKATGATASCTVTVGKVVISMEDFTLKKSRTTVLTATLYPTNLEDKSVIWKSSNEKIATVTNEGKVKGIKAGTATITCTSVATGLSGTCTVTVLAKTESRSLDGEGEGTTGIDGLENAATAPFDVYDLNGRKVLSGVTSLDGLPNGVYVVNGKKMLKK